MQAIPLNILRRHAWSRCRAPSRYFRFAARCVCLIALLIMVATIGAYVYWTEPHRVRGLAENFLSRVINGDISIGQAKLSIFEGLQLDDVRIALRDSASTVRGAPRTLISVKRLQISYSTLALLHGDLESGRVVAIGPEVYLVEDVSDGPMEFAGAVSAAGNSQAADIRSVVAAQAAVVAGGADSRRVDSPCASDGERRNMSRCRRCFWRGSFCRDRSAGAYQFQPAEPHRCRHRRPGVSRGVLACRRHCPIVAEECSALVPRADAARAGARVLVEAVTDGPGRSAGVQRFAIDVES